MWTGTKFSLLAGLRKLSWSCACWLSLVGAAHAADQWNAGTLTGTGRTETLAYPATCSSTTALAINRRGTSLTNALSKYVTTGAGDLTVTAATPSAPTLMEKILGVGCNSTTALVSGSGVWIQSAPLDDFDPWNLDSNSSATGQSFSGTATATSPDKTWQLTNVFPGGSNARLFNFNVPWSSGNVASSAPLPGDQELVGTSINAAYYCSIAGEYSSGQPYLRGYTSGTSYAFTTQSATVVMNTSSYFYPPFGLSATACLATVKRLSNSHTYILSAPIGGTVTVTDAGVIDLIPLGDWDPTGSLRRAWWINKADGTVRVSNSATTVASIATSATYDIGSTPLGGSTPLFAITGLDMDGDGSATDNPVVLMADGTHFAWWGTQPVAATSTRPKRNATGPFNNLPFRAP